MPFIFRFEQLEKAVFISYKGFDHTTPIITPLRNHFLVISYALLPIFGKIMFGQKMLNKPR